MARCFLMNAHGDRKGLARSRTTSKAGSDRNLHPPAYKVAGAVVKEVSMLSAGHLPNYFLVRYIVKHTLTVTYWPFRAKWK